MLPQTPLLALLRRLEAQQIWRMSYNVLPMQQQYSTAAQVEPAGAQGLGFARSAACRHRLRRPQLPRLSRC